jgi:hypothetical protein
MPGEADPPSDPYAQAKRCLVSSLLDPRWRVEVEVDALVG